MVQNREVVTRTPAISGNARSKLESAVSHETKTTKVVDKVLSTPIHLSLGEVLGASKDISQEISNRIRYHKTVEPAPAANAEPEHVSVNFSKILRRRLIRLPMQCNNVDSVDFVLDTGSEINVINQALWQKLGVPLDSGPPVKLRDANGGTVILTGIVHGLHLRYGPIESSTNFYVSNRAPFVGLLGLPWMSENGVSLSIQPEHGEVHLTFAAYPEKIIILPGIPDDSDDPIAPESYMMEIVEDSDENPGTKSSASQPAEIGEAPPMNTVIPTADPVSKTSEDPENVEEEPDNPENMSLGPSDEFVDAQEQFTTELDDEALTTQFSYDS